MIRLKRVYGLLLIPLIAGLALLPGCEDGLKSKGKPRISSSASSDEGETPKVPLTAAKFGTITGKVTYEGERPAEVAINMGPNETACHASPKPGDELESAWQIDSNGGVMDAVVFLQPPVGKFFQLPDDLKKPRKGDELVKLHQPRCQFIPRVFVLYPSYYDPAKNAEVPTGQQFEIANDAPFEHNFGMLNCDENTPRGGTVKPGKVEVFPTLVPETRPIIFKCDIHGWMRAYGFVLDHPYAAVTKADGTFQIDNVPLDVELQVVAWHEAKGFFNGGEQGKKETLTDNKQFDFKIKR
jgi:hypothetical protein